MLLGIACLYLTQSSAFSDFGYETDGCFPNLVVAQSYGSPRVLCLHMSGGMIAHRSIGMRE